MRATILLLTAATAVLFAQQQQQQQRDLRIVPTNARKMALVVGNSAYPKSPLRNPANDARAIAGMLTELGFQTQSALDVNLRNLERSVNEFVSRVGPGDVAMFYYAGHGIQLEGENYLVPVDFDAKDEADAKYASYSVSRVQERLEKAGARVVLMVLDACRNNPFQASRSVTGGGGLAAMGSGKGTLIAFATAPGKTADDNPRGNNGLFTSHLVTALKEPGLSVDQVFNRVRERVYEDSGGKQVPWTVSSVIGDLFLRPGANGTPAPAKQQVAQNQPQPVAQNPFSRANRVAAPAAPVEESRPIPPPVDSAAAVSGANAALERGDFEEAIRASSAVLRNDPQNKDALLVLAGGYYRTQRWDVFVPTARQAVAAGATLTILLGHHHTLTGIHASALVLANGKIGFRSLGGSCNQNPIEVPFSSLVSAQGMTSPQGEIFLNVKLLDDKNKQRNFNFADPDSTVSQNQQSGLPVIMPTPKSAQLVQSLATLINALRR